MAGAIEVRNLEISYGGEPVIRDLTTAFESGTFIGLIGPNGAGKSTLLMSISGQFKPQSGQVIYEGLDVYKHNVEFKRMIGYVHENPFFYPYLRVEEFLHFIARVKNIATDEIDAQISGSLNAVRLSEEAQKPASDLSMGMRKKLAIAAALLGKPKIIFLDEALNGIDIESAFHIKKVLGDFVANGGTVILSTHVLQVIEKICDRFLVMKQGQIVADLGAENLKQSDDAAQDLDLEEYIIQLLSG